MPNPLSKTIEEQKERARERAEAEFRFYSFSRKMSDDELANTDPEDLEDGEPFTEAEPSDFEDWAEDLTETTSHAILKALVEVLEGEKLGGEGKPIFVGANASERMKIHNQALSDIQTIINNVIEGK